MARKAKGDFAMAPEEWVFEERLGVISPEAFRTWVLMTCFSASKHSDGYVDRYNANRLCFMTPELEKELHGAGLMVEEGSGYVVRSHDGSDWSETQYTSAEREEDRAKRSAAGRKGGNKSAEARQPKVEAGAASGDYNHERMFDVCWDAYKAPNRTAKVLTRQSPRKPS
jgi:hypothetical protein